MSKGAKIALIIVLLILAGWLFYVRGWKYINPPAPPPIPEEPIGEPGGPPAPPAP